ncbi:alpha-1,2-fucosyltransferase [Sporomusa malonica]|uniref:Glycosyl transferase family 11 n=1 Tax=Sporomusa malonica TaxID=112901 RepID=A0A1W2EM93_9FIRM|nr:alpha-1,2-fucosyltransferase [Sporomusa malonica]SMD10837.1 Glycosyl transferase family 11 [Sporomusa malonica]
MIVVQLMGGMGNQMFQYACGRALALRTNKQLYLDVGHYYANNKRRYELEKLNIQATPIPLLDELKDRLQVINERQFNFDPNIIALRDNVILSGGYWQSEKYFLDFASVIREELTPKRHNLSAESLNVAMDMKNYTSIAIHVRRGDYELLKGHGVLPMDYYEQASSYLAAKGPSARFYLFSDDIEWCKREFTAFPNAHLVEHTREKGSHEDLWLMSQCQHNVIANSTYSWWGAWLNDNPQKIIIAPERWFAGLHLNTQDLIPNDWIKLPIQR